MPTPRSVLWLVLLLVLAARLSLPPALAAEGAAAPRPGEIRLDGVLHSLDRAKRTGVLEATSFTLPNGRSSRFEKPRPKRLGWGPELQAAALKPGGAVGVIGRDDPKSGVFSVRVVVAGAEAPPAASGGGGGQPAEPVAGAPGKKPAPAAPVVVGLDRLPLPPAPPADRPDLVPQVSHGLLVDMARIMPDGRTLITAAIDRTWKLWDLETGRLKLTRMFPGTPEPTPPAVLPNLGGLVFGIHGGVLAIVDPLGGRQVRRVATRVPALGPLIASPNGKYVAASVLPSRGVALLSLEDGESLWTTTEMVPMTAAAFAPDSKVLASGSADGTVRLRDVASGKVLLVLPDPGSLVAGLAFSPDGGLLAVLSTENAQGKVQVRLFETQTGTARRSISVPGRTLSWVLAFSPDGRLVLTGTTDGIAGWDVNTGQQQFRIAAVTGASSLWVPADGRRLISGNFDGTAAVMDLLPAPGAPRFYGRAEWTERAAFSRGGHWAAQATWDGAVSIWDLHTGSLSRRLQMPGGAFSVEFSPDETRLLTGGRNEVRIWDWALGKPLARVTAPARNAFFLPGGRRFATLWQGDFRTWDAVTGAALQRLPAPSVLVNGAGISPDGKHVLAAMNDGRVLLWGPDLTAEPRELDRLDGVAVTVAFSPDGRRAACGGWDGTARVYDLERETRLLVLSHLLPPVTTAQVDGIAFSPDSRRLATVGSAGLVIWDLSRRTPLRVLPGTAWAPRMAWSADGTRLFVVSGRLLELWEPDTGRLLARLMPMTSPDRRAAAAAGWLIVTPEGYYDCSEGADREIQWRQGERYVPFSVFEESFRSPGRVRAALRAEAVPAAPLTLARISPDCRILEPKDGAALGGASLPLVVEATDDRSLQRFKVWINGLPVPDRDVKAEQPQVGPIPAEAKGAAPEHRVRCLLRAAVPLPPGERELRVRVEAYDDENNRGDAAISVRRPDEAPARGDLYVLCVGVSQYRDPRYNLKYAAADARDLAKALEKQASGVYGRAHAAVLVDGRATAEGIRGALKGLAGARAQDTVLLFFSGHGVQEGGKFYFAPHGVAVEKIAATCVPWNEIVQALAKVPGRKLLLADACHSGGKLGAQQASSDDLAGAARRTGIVMLASSRGDQFSYEDPKLGHGAFTAALLEALAGKASSGGGAVTLKQVLEYVPERVAKLTEERQTPWVPQLEEFSLDVALARVNAPG